MALNVLYTGCFIGLFILRAADISSRSDIGLGTAKLVIMSGSLVIMRSRRITEVDFILIGLFKPI